MRSETQDNATLHAWSLAGMAMLLVATTGAAFFGGTMFGGGPAMTGPDLSKLEAIEASVAYKKSTPQKQPQKQKKAPDPVVTPQGVSHDDQAKPITKPDEPDKKPGDKPTLDDFKRKNTDEDLDVGKPVDPSSAFDEDRFGFANETKGDPYVQDLLLDLIEAGGEYPALLDTAGVPIGCFHMSPDGKILDTLMREKSENDELNDFAERALNGLKKKRNADPIAIPDKPGLQALMTEWTCFAFKL
jgi:hypothetical protein